MADVIDGGTGEDGGDVTFVGGKAVEQTTQGEEPSGDHGDELAAAKAAVKKAMDEDLKEEGKKAAKEAKTAREKDPLVPRDRGPDGKFIPNPEADEPKAKPAETVKQEDPDAGALRKALLERKETAKYKADVNAQLEKDRNEVRQIHQRLLEKERRLEAEREKFSMFRKDPVRAIRENGWDKPEDFILDIAQDGTPEGQARRAQRELVDRLQKAEAWQKQQEDAVRAQQEEFAQNQRRSHRETVERTFLAEASKHEALVGMYKGDEVALIAQADAVAEQYRNVTGKEATLAEIAEYIAERTEKWYKSRVGTQGAPVAQAAPVHSGRPTPGSATGKKSLSPAGSSERRSLGQAMADLDGDERREAAMTAVKAAIHASGER